PTAMSTRTRAGIATLTSAAPPPAKRTSTSTRWESATASDACNPSLDAYARFRDHLPPFLDVGADAGAQLLGSAGVGFQALCDERRAHIFLLQHRGQLPIQ